MKEMKREREKNVWSFVQQLTPLQIWFTTITEDEEWEGKKM